MGKQDTTVEFEANLDNGKVEIKAPWGEVSMDAGEYTPLIQHALKQLIYFRDVQGNKSQHLADDIKGYEQILSSSNPEKNAGEFLKKKHEAMMTSSRFKDNLAVIEAIKAGGAWVE